MNGQVASRLPPNKMGMYREILLKEKQSILNKINDLNNKFQIYTSKYERQKIGQEIEMFELTLEKINEYLVRFFNDHKAIYEQLQYKKNNYLEMEYLLKNKYIDEEYRNDLINRKLDYANFVNEVLINSSLSGGISNIPQNITVTNDNFYPQIKHALDSQYGMFDNINGRLNSIENTIAQLGSGSGEPVYIEQPVLIQNDDNYSYYPQTEPPAMEEVQQVTTEEYFPENNPAYQEEMYVDQPIVTTQHVEHYPPPTENKNQPSYIDDDMFYDDDEFDSSFD